MENKVAGTGNKGRHKREGDGELFMFLSEWVFVHKSVLIYGAKNLVFLLRKDSGAIFYCEFVHVRLFAHMLWLTLLWIHSLKGNKWMNKQCHLIFQCQTLFWEVNRKMCNKSPFALAKWRRDKKWMQNIVTSHG